MAATLAVAVALLLLSQTPAAAADSVTNEAAVLRHLRKLTAKFGPDVLPVTSSEERVLVSIQLRPLQLVEVDSALENLRVTAMLIVSWTDKLIVWNASDFGNVRIVFVDHRTMWVPQLLIHGAVGDEKQMLQVDSPLTVISDSPKETGVVAIWVHEFHTTCDFDTNRFPIDEQVCELPLTATSFRQPLYGSRSYVAAVSAKTVTSMFIGNSEWNLTEFDQKNATREFTLANGDRYNLTTATAVFRIRRYSTYYQVVSTVPLVLLTVLQLLIYLVPLESGEKTGCGVTILLSFTVFLLLIDYIVPKSQIVPTVVYFITVALVISAASLVYNCLLLRMYHTAGSTRMPHCVEKLLVQGLGRLMCVRCCEDRKSEYEVAACSSDPRDGCNNWKLAAASLERLGFLIHLLCVAASLIWLQQLT